MRRYINRGPFWTLIGGVILLVIFAWLVGCTEPVFAQISTRPGVQGNIICSGYGAGVPTQVSPRQASRVYVILKNIDSVDVRIGIDTGSAQLTDTNAFRIGPGAVLNLTPPGQTIGEIRCAGTDVNNRTINVHEGLR